MSNIRANVAITGAAASAFALALASAIGTAAPVSRPAAHSGVATPSKAGLITVPAEGGQTTAPVYRGWMDYYGLAIPGDTQGAPGGQPLDAGAQFLFAGVAATAALNDYVNQQSGWNDTIPAPPPNFNGSPVYGGQAETYVTTCPSPNPHDVAQCGYQPVAAKGLEPRDGTTQGGNSNTPDSIIWADGAAPANLASLSTFNNSNGQPGGYNLQRGPLLQVPILGNGIAIVFNATNLTIPAGGLKLSRNSMCGIFQGLITNWDDPSITNDNGGSVGNQPLVLVHRSDGAGTTFILSYAASVFCSQSNVQTSYQWVQGVGTLSQNGGSPQNNTVTWPTTSIPEKGNGALADYIAANAGAIGYVGTPYVARAGGNEAYVQNQAGGFVQATVAAIKAAIAGGPYVKANQTTEIPPGYPYIKNVYLPLPGASGAAPIVGFSYAFFYPCTAQREKDQISALKSFFKWALTPENGGGPTPADTIAESNGLVELPDKAPKASTPAKNTSDKLVAGTAAYAGSHSGTYLDPSNGNTLNYTCTPLQ
jgi:ABC-type phosphate transport system substrate-binding protein